MTSRRFRRCGEEGAALLFVMLFVLAMALSLVAMGTLATNSLLGSTNLRAERTALADAESDVTLWAQYLRGNFVSLGFYSATQGSCQGLTGASIPSADTRNSSNAHISVLCSATLAPNTANTRTVDFYAYLCNSFQGCGSTSGTLILHAQAIYDDLPVSGSPSCSSTSTTTCGEAMTMSTWDEAQADS